MGAEEYKKASTTQKLGRDPVTAGCCHESPREEAVFFRTQFGLGNVGEDVLYPQGYGRLVRGLDSAGWL